MMSARNRDISYRKALRKRRIDRMIYHSRYNNSDWYDNLHQYSKNKVHCSCNICRRKTKNKGHKRLRYGNYDNSHNWKASDTRKIQRLEYQLEDEEF